MNNHKGNPTDMIFKQLSESLNFLAREICASRDQRTIELEWFKSNLRSATKQDIDKAKSEIIKAFGERVDSKTVNKLTNDLRKSSEPLAKAVEDNTPISS